MTKFGPDGTYCAYFPFRPNKEGQKMPYKIEKSLVAFSDKRTKVYE